MSAEDEAVIDETALSNELPANEEQELDEIPRTMNPPLFPERFTGLD